MSPFKFERWSLCNHYQPFYFPLRKKHTSFSNVDEQRFDRQLSFLFRRKTQRTRAEKFSAIKVSDGFCYQYTKRLLGAFNVFATVTLELYGWKLHIFSGNRWARTRIQGIVASNMCGFVNGFTDRMASLQDDMEVWSHNFSSSCLPKLHHHLYHGLSSGVSFRLLLLGVHPPR